MDQATDQDSAALDETVATPDVKPEIETRPLWQSKLNLGVLALAIALLCGANESDTAMTWMNAPTPIDRMPGLVSDTDIDRLLSSKGADADKLFAQLMIAHHQGGIHIAQYAVDHANVIEVRRLAYAMVTGQTGEISELQALIAA